MNGSCLVDSSAWVEAGRPGGDPEIVARLADLVSSGLAAMTEPVWMELYQGIRGKREEARLEMTRSLCVWLEFDSECPLDSGLPEKYTTELFEQKCGVLFQHVLEKYPDQGASVYAEAG
jgi:hypothetical protein